VSWTIGSALLQLVAVPHAAMDGVAPIVCRAERARGIGGILAA
jgi:hypothetical protein